MKKMGRLERLASARPVSQVVYQATPASPTACGLSGTSIALRVPLLLDPRCPQQIAENKNSRQTDNISEFFIPWSTKKISRKRPLSYYTFAPCQSGQKNQLVHWLIDADFNTESARPTKPT